MRLPGYGRGSPSPKPAGLEPCRRRRSLSAEGEFESLGYPVGYLVTPRPRTSGRKISSTISTRTSSGTAGTPRRGYSPRSSIIGRGAPPRRPPPPGGPPPAPPPAQKGEPRGGLPPPPPPSGGSSCTAGSAS